MVIRLDAADVLRKTTGYFGSLLQTAPHTSRIPRGVAWLAVELRSSLGGALLPKSAREATDRGAQLSATNGRSAGV
jgi:hypothetical protein